MNSLRLTRLCLLVTSVCLSLTVFGLIVAQAKLNEARREVLQLKKDSASWQMTAEVWHGLADNALKELRLCVAEVIR